jgi:hypothetical protein
MTVSEAMVARYSPYTVGDTGDMTSAEFTLYSTEAAAILALDNPGLSSTVYDICHVLMILHLFESSKGNLDMKSEKLDNYSYTREHAGETSYLTQYNMLIEKYTDTQGGLASFTDAEDVERADKDMDELLLDQRDSYGVDLTDA